MMPCDSDSSCRVFILHWWNKASALREIKLYVCLSVGGICMRVCFDHCSYVSRLDMLMFVSHALCFYPTFCRTYGEWLKCKLCIKAVHKTYKVALLGAQPKIHLLSHTLMSSLSSSPPLSSIIQ